MGSSEYVAEWADATARSRGSNERDKPVSIVLITDDYGFDLGAHTHTITTDSPEAQTWFDRGLNWCYAFSREEAHRCFEKVVEHDPD